MQADEKLASALTTPWPQVVGLYRVLSPASFFTKWEVSTKVTRLSQIRLVQGYWMREEWPDLQPWVIPSRNPIAGY